MAQQLSDIECMLVVIYKKLDDIQRQSKQGFRSASLSTYYDELKKEADKVRESINQKNS